MPNRSPHMIWRLLALLAVGIALTPAGCRGNSATPFDADRAFGDLKKQVAFGPRVPGSSASLQCRQFLIAELKKSADSVEDQRFQLKTSARMVPMSNIIARFNPRATRKILLCAHWDSRPFADHDLRPELRDTPIPGANDGASGVAVLLELARQFKAQAPGIGVVIVFFDGEDWGRTEDQMYYGSRYYARNLKKEKFEAAILLDMIGDKDLQIYREQFSEDKARPLNDLLWKTAADFGYAKSFPDKVKYSITDDQIPLQQAGINAIDVIDFDYAYWHTTEDTPDKCSPQSLKIVGEVVQKVVRDWK